MLCNVLAPSVIEEELCLHITQSEAHCLTQKRSPIVNTPEPKGGSMVERKAIVFSLKGRKRNMIVLVTIFNESLHLP